MPQAEQPSVPKRKKPHLRMPLLDKVTLDPFQKYIRYNKFPLKMLVHLLLAIVVTAQVLLVINSNSSYDTTIMRQLYTIFFDEEMELDGLDYFREKYYYDVEDVRDHVIESIENYYGINDLDTIEEYELINETDVNGDSKIIPVIMIPYFIHKKERNTWNTLNFNLTNDFLGPFELENDDLQMFLSNITDFRLTYEIRHNMPVKEFTTYDCYKWIVTQDYSFVSRSRISEIIRMEKQLCDTINSSEIHATFFTSYIWVHIGSIVLSIIFLIFNVKYVKDISESFERVNQRFSSDTDGKMPQKTSYKESLDSIRSLNRIESFQSTTSDDLYIPEEHRTQALRWDDLTFKEKWKLFSGWVILMIIGSICSIIASFFFLASTRTSQRSGELVLGFGSFLILTSLMKYIEGIKAYNVILNTMTNSMMITVKALIGSGPIIIFFAVLGNALFLESDRFSDMATTLYTLFSYANGDLIFASFFELKELSYLVSEIYVYLFVFISVCVIFNVLVVIISDGYVAAKYFKKYDWIKDEDFEDEDIRPKAHMLFGAGAEQGENPLKPFQKQSKKQEAVNNLMKDILNLDKKLTLEEYAREKGIDTNNSGGDSPAHERISTPISQIERSQEPIFISTMDSINLMNELEQNLAKVVEDSSRSDSEIEDLKDRYRNVVNRLQKRIDQLSEDIEVEFEG